MAAVTRWLDVCGRQFRAKLERDGESSCMAFCAVCDAIERAGTAVHDVGLATIVDYMAGVWIARVDSLGASKVLFSLDEVRLAMTRAFSGYVEQTDDKFLCSARQEVGQGLLPVSVEKWYSIDQLQEADLDYFPSVYQFVAAEPLLPRLNQVGAWRCLLLGGVAVLRYSDDVRDGLLLSDVDMTSVEAGRPLVTDEFYSHVVVGLRQSNLFRVKLSTPCCCVAGEIDTTAEWCSSAVVCLTTRGEHISSCGANPSACPLISYLNAAMAVHDYPRMMEAGGYCYTRAFPAVLKLQALLLLRGFPTVRAVGAATTMLGAEVVWNARLEAEVIEITSGRYHLFTEGQLPSWLEPNHSIGSGMATHGDPAVMAAREVLAGLLSPQADPDSHRRVLMSESQGPIDVGTQPPPAAPAVGAVVEGAGISIAMPPEDTNYEARCFGVSNRRASSLSGPQVAFSNRLSVGQSSSEWASPRHAEVDAERAVALRERLTTNEAVVGYDYLKRWEERAKKLQTRPLLEEPDGLMVYDWEGLGVPSGAYPEFRPTTVHATGWVITVANVKARESFRLKRGAVGSRYEFRAAGQSHTARFTLIGAGQSMLPIDNLALITGPTYSYDYGAMRTTVDAYIVRWELMHNWFRLPPRCDQLRLRWPVPVYTIPRRYLVESTVSTRSGVHSTDGMVTYRAAFRRGKNRNDLRLRTPAKFHPQYGLFTCCITGGTWQVGGADLMDRKTRFIANVRTAFTALGGEKAIVKLRVIEDDEQYDNTYGGGLDVTVQIESSEGNDD